MIFNSKYKKAGSDLFEAIGEIHNFIYKEIKQIDELNEVVSNDELFSNELLFILFFFSKVHVQEYFSDKTVSKNILDELRNTYYSVLRKDMVVSKKVIKNINVVLNMRYSSYEKIYDESENIIMNITDEFLINMKFEQTNNLDISLRLSFWLAKANEILNKLMKKIELHYKISK